MLPGCRRAGDLDSFVKQVSLLFLKDLTEICFHSKQKAERRGDLTNKFVYCMPISKRENQNLKFVL